MVLARVVIFFVPILLLFVVFLIIWLVPQKNIGGCRAIRWVRVKVFWAHSVHTNTTLRLGQDRVRSFVGSGITNSDDAGQLRKNSLSARHPRHAEFH